MCGAEEKRSILVWAKIAKDKKYHSNKQARRFGLVKACCMCRKRNRLSQFLWLSCISDAVRW